MDKIKPHLQKAGRLLFEHFEKIILAVVLVILAYDSFNMVFGISGEKRGLETVRNTLKNTAPGGRVLTYDPSCSFKRYIENDGTESFDEMNALLAKGHRVFNPDVWKRLSNRVVRIRSGDEFGWWIVAVHARQQACCTRPVRSRPWAHHEGVAIAFVVPVKHLSVGIQAAA